MNIDYKEIGKRVRAARRNAGYTQEKLAEILEISSAHLSNIERGITKVGLPRLVSIANALSLSGVDQLIYESIQEHTYQYHKEAMALLEDCDSYEKKQLIEMLRQYKTQMRAWKQYYRNLQE